MGQDQQQAIEQERNGPSPKNSAQPSTKEKIKEILPTQTEDAFNSLSIFDSSIDYHNVKCQICGLIKFTGSRFHCVVCKDSICGACFQRRKETATHHIDHLTVYIPMPLTHWGEQRLGTLTSIITREKKMPIFDYFKEQTEECCRCGVDRGLRVKCEECRQLILCLECFRIGSKGHDITHRFIVFISQMLKEFELDGQFEIEKSLKKGCFGNVKRVKHKASGEVFALKTIEADLMSDWGNEQFKSFENEKRAYFQLRSSNIVACFGCMRKKVSEKKYSMYLLLQWCERGNLSDLISNHQSYRKISFRRRMGIVKTMVAGLRLIHSKGFVHKDIKPDNILLDRYLEVKIGDLGIAVEYVQNKEMYSLAHQEYAAPELKSGEKAKYDNKVDIYSLGLVMNLIFTEKKHKFKKEKGKLLVDFPEPSQFFFDIIEQCVEYSPSLRPSSARIELFFDQFDEFFWKAVRQKYDIREYEQMASAMKNDIFRGIYAQFYKNYHFKPQQ